MPNHLSFRPVADAQNVGYHLSSLVDTLQVIAGGNLPFRFTMADLEHLEFSRDAMTEKSPNRAAIETIIKAVRSYGAIDVGYFDR